MGAYLLPVIAFVILLVMILRDAEQYKRAHPRRDVDGWSPFKNQSHGRSGGT